MDGDDIGIDGPKAFDRGLAAVGGVVVHDPEHTPGVAVRGLVHDLSNQTIERLDASIPLAMPEDFSSVHIESCHVGPGSAAGVLVFDAGGLAWKRRQRSMLTNACLDAGFLVGTDHELVAAESLLLPLSGIQVENAPGFVGEIPIAREYPAAMLPGADGIFFQPSPHSLVADGHDDTAAQSFADNVRSAQA